MSLVTKQDIINAINNGTLTDADLDDISNHTTTKKLKVNLITINQGGDQVKYLNNSTLLFDGSLSGVPSDKRRFANNIIIKCKATDENVIISQLVPIISVLGLWNYRIINRDRQIDEKDASKITNVFTMDKNS